MDRGWGDVDLREAQGAQVGDGNRQYNFFVGAPGEGPRPGVYLEQVRRIAPPELAGREAELAELAAFCLDPGAGPYAWWQADPWAGKSALLSAFVLRPPPEVAGRVRLVSFFITARLAAQDTREAFIQVLLEQLAGLTGERLPAVLPEATREAFLLDLVSRAAAGCQAAGGRLVLVVDGLDEDRGVTVGPGACSIAGLLPAAPPHGMRVVVAGRPNPPVPDDVPDWHPLRDPGIVRPLPGSAYARDVKRLSGAELQRLLRGSRAGQDVLGLLAAARGGLSARDLEELAGIPLWEVEQVLHTASGRTFTRRASRWAPGTGPETYLLGHEELQAAAVSYLGSGRLAGHRDRLHAWAGGYRARGWPAGTPHYLLSGYYGLLADLGDVPRMTECGSDAARHDRMLDITGGDAAALAEARTALDRIAAQDTPDLSSALAVAFHRDQLTTRNRGVPPWLPGVWAALGRLPRAEALAASATDPVTRARALAGIAQALAAAGQHEHVTAIAGQAEATARSVSSPSLRVKALAAVSEALGRAGQHGHAAAVAGQAEASIESITRPDRKAEALASIAEALGRAGQHGHAAAVAGQAEASMESITDPELRQRALACIAGALSWAGLLEQAEEIARSITSPADQAGALAGVAEALAAAGRHDQAMAAAEQAEAAAQAVVNPSERAGALSEVVRALARAGELEQAEAAARSVTGPWGQARTLAHVAEALAAAGQHERATAVAEQAEAAARTLTHDNTYPWALARVARALARAGQHEHAGATAARAEAATRSIPYAVAQAQALADAAGAHAWAGQVEKAEAAAASITNSAERARALAGIAEALAAAGQHERAAATGVRAEAIARSVTDPFWKAHALAGVAGALARAGQAARAVAAAAQAETAARSVTDPEWQVRALAEVAGALAWAGQCDYAETVARSATDPEWQADALAEVAGALAWAGQVQRAEAIAQSIVSLQSWEIFKSPTSPDAQSYAMARVAEALASTGDVRNAIQLTAAACVAGNWTIALGPLLMLAPSAVTLAISQVEAW